MIKVPYLSYLKNLREAPNKASAAKGSPTKGIVAKPPSKADLAVYDKDQDEVQVDLIRNIKLDDQVKAALREAMDTPPTPTNDDIKQGVDAALRTALEEEATPPSGGLMSPESAEEPVAPSGSYSEDPELGAFSDTISILQDNTEFMTQLDKMTEKYPGLTEREVFMVAAKESSVGTNMGSAGNMFQILGTPAKEAGIDLTKLKKSTNMTDHLKALEKYLDRWDYDGKAPLGLVIAAPSYRNASSDAVVYSKEEDSDILEANPGWAGPDGNATVASITKFYRG